MSGHKILAPHKEQDGWRYIRVQSSITMANSKTHLNATRVFRAALTITSSFMDGAAGDLKLSYRDDEPWSRIISSRRVEQDVETGDFLRLCADEGLEVRCGYRIFDNADLTRPLLGWAVWDGHMKRATPPIKSRTLREAYHRYHAKADAE